MERANPTWFSGLLSYSVSAEFLGVCSSARPGTGVLRVKLEVVEVFMDTVKAHV